MHCCGAWEPVGKCFDQCSFECIEFHGLSQIIASLTRERIAEREAGHRRKKTALAKCRLGLLAWRAKKPMLCLHAVTDEDVTRWKNEAGKIFEARVEGEQHSCHVTILQYVQTAPDDFRWQMDRHEFDEMIATKRNLLQVQMGFRSAFTDVREDWALSSYSTRINMCLKVVLSLHSSLRVEPSSFPSPLMSTTLALL